MALTLLQSGIQPLGQYDGYASFSPKGGEVGVLITTGTTTDGYQVLHVRGATTGDSGPFYLVDDGTGLGYGVLFGNTVLRTDTGFTSGAQTTGPLGPATSAASGKLTLWEKPGTYAVSLDALFDTEATLKNQAPGTKLTVDPATSRLKVGSPSSGAFAWVLTFKVDESLVTTGGAVVNHKKLVVSFNGYAAATI